MKLHDITLTLGSHDRLETLTLLPSQQWNRSRWLIQHALQNWGLVIFGQNHKVMLPCSMVYHLNQTSILRNKKAGHRETSAMIGSASVSSLEKETARTLNSCGVTVWLRRNTYTLTLKACLGKSLRAVPILSLKDSMEKQNAYGEAAWSSG